MRTTRTASPTPGVAAAARPLAPGRPGSGRVLFVVVVLTSCIVAALLPTTGARATVGVDPYYSGTLAYDRTFDTTIPTEGGCTGTDRLVWDEHWVITLDPVPEGNGPDTAQHRGTISGTVGYTNTQSCNGDVSSLSGHFSGSGPISVYFSRVNGQIELSTWMPPHNDDGTGQGIPGTITRSNPPGSKSTGFSPYVRASFADDASGSFGSAVASTVGIGDQYTDTLGSSNRFPNDTGTLQLALTRTTPAAPTPIPTPTPTPTPGVRPVAGCDVYVTAPGTTLRVPAHTGLLANDRDPRGLRLRPSVTKISFGKATHPYTVAANGAFTLKTTKKDRRLVMTYSAVNSKGARSAPTTALVLVTTRRLTDDQLRSCDGSGRVVQPPPRAPRFLTKSCTGMAVQTTTFQVTDKKKGIKGTLTYGIRKPKGNNLCWERGWPTSDDVWKVRGQAWVKWSGTPAKPDAIGFTDTIKVNGTSMSVSVPISVSVTESGGSVKMKVTNTKKGTTSAADLDYRTVDIKVSAYSSGTISHTISPFVKIKGSTKVAKAAGDHNCVKASLSGYYWGETYSNCF